MPESKDTDFMMKALRLALKGEGHTSPNPMVGAVVVKNGSIIGRGYHSKAGYPHAEIEAFNDAHKKKHSLAGSDLYVTLEPCCHKEKRTPPCTDEIIKSGIKRVFIGTLDPNPKVSGNGVRHLISQGIDVKTGVLEEQCRNMNEIFNHYIVTGLPFVILKSASTLDGMIASKTGDSKWIGSSEQRKNAHLLRSKVDGVVVGINTVLKDDPRLNVRLEKKKISKPVPVVLDSRLRIPLESKIFKLHERSIIVTTVDKKKKEKKLEETGAEIIKLKPGRSGKISIKKLLRKLGKMEISSLLVEGGGTVAASFLKEKCVDKVCIFISPRILGGDGVNMIAGLGMKSIKESIDIKNMKFKKFGNEIMIEGYI